MRIKNNKIKFLIVSLILFICCLFVRTNDTLAIYKSTVSTTVNLTVLDPSTNFVVTLALNDGSGTTSTVNKHYNEQMGSDLTTPTLADHNFMGWYTDPTNGTKVSSSITITSNITFYAHWSKIVCKKVTNDTDLHKETCNTTSGHGCRISNVYALNDPITYGTTVENDDPKAGDAFDCDVDYDGVYNPGDPYTNGKYTERFYFIREKENSGSENSVVLVYYTSFDADGRVGIPPKVKNDIGSYPYVDAQTYLPTSTLWDNPKLADFDGNGKVSRFLTLDDLHESCGPDTTVAHYLNNCEYLLENSRFQSEDLGRAGIWLEMSGNKYYRIQTSGLTVNTPDTGANSENMVRPVIEIPISALEGYINEERYTITFNSHGGSSVDSIKRYNGYTIGAFPTDPTLEHHTFDGWYADYTCVNNNCTYSNPVTTSTIVTSDMTLHAKWISLLTKTVRFDANGGEVEGEDYIDVVVDNGDTIDPLPVPTWSGKYFTGWYLSDLTTRFTENDPVNSNFTVYAQWEVADYAAEVNGVGYTTLADAIASVPATGVKTEVKILKNLTLASADVITIPNTKYVDLNLNQYTISGNEAILFTVAGGGTDGAKLEVRNGTINNTGSYAAIKINKASGKKGTLYIKDGAVISSTGTTNAIQNEGNIEMTGGTVTCSANQAAINNGTVNNSTALLTMSGGSITTSNSQKAQAIYNNYGATVEISGTAYLYSQSSDSANLRGTLHNYSGTMYITGGTIVSKNFNAVVNNGTMYIGDDDGNIDISTPVMRGKEYGLQSTTTTISVYDGIFESYNNSRAISVSTVTTPTGINFVDSTIDVEGDTYYSTYLYSPTYKVNFYPENGDNMFYITVNNGSTIGGDMPSDPTKTDYYFDGWYDGNTQITSSTTVDRLINAYARWVQSISNATIASTLSVEVNDSETIAITGTDLESVTYSSSDTTVATVDANGAVTGVDVGTATITITGSKSGDTRTVTVTVTPDMFTVTFLDSDGQTEIYTRNVASGSSLGANMPSNPTNINSNYVFDSWTIENTMLTFTSSTQVIGDLNVIANWAEKVTYATLTTSPSPIEIGIGNTGQITLSATVQGDTVESCTYTPVNSSIATVDANGEVTGVAAGTTDITITGSKSGATRTVAVTVGNYTMYRVTFLDADGQTVLFTRDVMGGSSLGASMPTATKTNYIFKGWTIENTMLAFTSSTQVTGNINVIASWDETIAIATITTNPSPLRIMLGSTGQITVSATGGGTVESYTISSSDTNIATVSNGTVYGEDLGTVTLTITGSVSGSTQTVQASFVNSHKVTFKDGDTIVKEIEVDVNSTIDPSDLPTDPVKSGYTFDRWYYHDGNDVTTTPLDTTKTITSDEVYVAVWAGANDVAAIGTTYYTTIYAALAAVPTTGVETEVRILQDITNPSGRATVSDGRNAVVNGNGHRISCGSSTTGNLIYANGGTLTVKNGTYTCNTSGLATLEAASTGVINVIDATIENTGDRGAIYNSGTVNVYSGTITSSCAIRSTILNATNGSSLTMYGGTVTQTATHVTDAKGYGAIQVGNAGASATILGGTVTSSSDNSAAVYSKGTLVIGTKNNAYDVTSPVIQNANYYGVDSSTTYSIFDGIIKGVHSSQKAVNDFNKINETTGIETGSTRQTGTDGAYYTLYYTLASTKYHIDLNAGDGEVTPNYVEVDLNDTLTANDLPTPTNGVYHFDGWYTDSNKQNAFTSITPTVADTVTYYAKWSFISSYTPVTHDINSDAMAYYFNNISTWITTDSTDPSNNSANYDDRHALFYSSMSTNFSDNNCSQCNGANTCTSPGAGTYCDQPKEFDTGLPDDLDVYLYDNNQVGSLVTYTTSEDGVIYNMIPGQTYYWESQSDSTKYGVVTATGERRTLKTDVRNLRDLGGLSVSYTDIDTGNTVTGTIDYGRLYRGAQITSSTGVSDLTKLGVTREIDLRGNGDGNQTYKMAYYDIGTNQSWQDIVIKNYHINPIATTYLPTEADSSDHCNSNHSDNYDTLKMALRKVMEYVVENHDSIYFHCTIGTDRTGTLAYFLEGLLGVSEEDRLRDYELSYYYGLTNRTRFHDYLSGSSINPRFESMYKSYPTNADIYNYYKYREYTPGPGEMTDDELITAFREELIH
ncbi:InlB B-repeat-containing protein [bacterium]|nr:InlB B-repeat-containing protein [bacterium]